MIYVRIIGGVMGPPTALPPIAKQLDGAGQPTGPFLEMIDQANREAAGYFQVVETPAPTLTVTQRANYTVEMVSGVPTQVWTVRTENAQEQQMRIRMNTQATIMNSTTFNNKLVELREFLTDADVAAFLNRNNNTPFGSADARALKTALRTIDRLTKAMERISRGVLGGAMLDDTTNV
jgi:hypothetical protein